MRRYAKPDDLITASEVASYAFCAEAWRLENGMGLPSANRKALDAGMRLHNRKAVDERIAGGALGLGRVLVVLAMLALVLLVVFSR